MLSDIGPAKPENGGERTKALEANGRRQLAAFVWL
jgi:hypothetical protein